MDDVAPILTERLLLEPIAPETLVALLAGDPAGASRVQRRELTPEFLDSVDDFFLRVQLERMSANPAGRGWCARTMALGGSGELVGHCGFHGPPADVGRAEIGYTVLPRHRGRGYATEAAGALLAWAGREGVRTVFAAVAPHNAPSLRVVEKLGFRRTGVQVDEIDGEELVFELDLAV